MSRQGEKSLCARHVWWVDTGIRILYLQGSASKIAIFEESGELTGFWGQEL